MTPDLIDFWKTQPDDSLSFLFEQAPFLMQTVDGDGTLTRVSRHWARTLGYDCNEMVGRRSVEFMTPACRKQAEEVIFPAFARTGLAENIDYDFLHKSGAVLPVLVSSCAVLDQEGSLQHYLSVITDMSRSQTIRRDLEQQLRDTDEASRAKSRFLSTMSHELRTPMNSILGFAQLLHVSGLDETRAGHVDSILSAGRTLMDLLNDLLDLGQVEAGKLTIEPRRLSLGTLIDTVSDWWLAAARDKGLRFSVSLEKGLPEEILCDGVRIQQILNNFLGNAIKFTTDGRIDLVVEEPWRDTRQSRLRFEVRDTGRGLSAAEIEQLFRPFVRLAETPARGESGWGLGLSICSNIAKAMGAEIGVLSSPGSGATFFLEILVERLDPQQPTANGPAASPPTVLPLPPPRRVARSGLKILLAEDNHVNAAMMLRVLDDMGHDVTRVETGHDALQALNALPCDLVIMDVMMPGLDGISTTRQIRSSQSKARDIPIIACSAMVSEEVLARHMQAGMNGFLSKPVDLDQLAETIERVLGAETDPAAQPDAGGDVQSDD